MNNVNCVRSERPGQNDHAWATHAHVRNARTFQSRFISAISFQAARSMQVTYLLLRWSLHSLYTPL